MDSAVAERSNIILVDADDTIENLLEAWVTQLNERYNLSVNPHDIIQWDISYYFPSLNNHQLYGILNEVDFWKKVSPKEDAIKYLSLLHQEGYVIKIVTASHHRTVHAKCDYCILKHFPFLDWKDIIICSDKQLLLGDILVDDNINNLIGGKYYPILFTANHNKQIDTQGITRVDNWKDCYNIIKSYLN